MRVWLNLDRMRAYNVSAEDVMKAVAEQSMIGSPGRLGQATGKTSQTVEYVLTWVGRYNKPEQYENIILKANPEGEILRLKDVAKVELGSSFFDIYSDIDGHPSAAIVLKQIPGSNAAAVIEEVKKKLEEIKKESFPPGMDYEVSYDVSNFLDASIEKVLHTLLEAFMLVSLVVYLFLGDLRSTLIPTLAVPVSLIGTFFFLQLFGLSINLITLFALVLAIGVVVDDAIVVVEAVHAKMAREAPLALSGDHGGDSRDQRRDHRHHPGDDRRLRSGDLHARAGRHLLPPVRHHDGHVHRSLRCGGPDAHAGSLCDDSQAPHPRATRHEPCEKTARTTGHSAVCFWRVVVLGDHYWRIICGGGWLPVHSSALCAASF